MDEGEGGARWRSVVKSLPSADQMGELSVCGAKCFTRTPCRDTFQ